MTLKIQPPKYTISLSLCVFISHEFSLSFFRYFYAPILTLFLSFFILFGTHTFANTSLLTLHLQNPFCKVKKF